MDTTTKTTTGANKAPGIACRLQKLPNEIRNRTVAFTVVKDGSVIITKRAKRSDKYTLHPSPPPLAYTCRQFYNEVVPVYYGRNTFVAYLPIRAKLCDPLGFSSLSRWLENAEARVTIFKLKLDGKEGAVRHVKPFTPCDIHYMAHPNT